MINAHQQEFLYFLGYFYLQHGKVDKAAAIFRALQAASPDQWRLRLVMAQTLLTAGMFELALKEARRARDLSSTVGEKKLTFFLLARILWNLDKKEESRELFREFLTLLEKE
jgi:tetratricopeptide (TPR) repeat protein